MSEVEEERKKKRRKEFKLKKKKKKKKRGSLKNTVHKDTHEKDFKFSPKN